MSCTIGNGAGDEDLSLQPLYETLSRRDVRSLIFHFLYALDAFDYDRSVEEVIEAFNKGFGLDVPLRGEVAIITQGVIDEQDMLDEMIKPFLLNWRFERIGVSTKLLLRMAVWELKQPGSVHNIVINESIELAKCFAEKDAYKFINGILDEAVKNIPSLQPVGE